MAKKKEKQKEDLAAELEESYAQWEHLKEHGGSDPFYADGVNLNLVRNHIIYYKRKLLERYGADKEKYPEAFYRELPPEADPDYMVRAGEIRDGAAQALECYLSDPNFLYLLTNQDMLTEKEAERISLKNVLGYASGLAKAVRDGDLVTMRRHAGRPEGYQESFARCAAQMAGLIDEKRKGPERADGQLTLFQFGLKTGRSR